MNFFRKLLKGKQAGPLKIVTDKLRSYSAQLDKLTPAYISEISPARMRGRLATIQQVAIITGLFVAFFSNYLVANAAGTSTEKFWMDYEAWRWMFWIELGSAVLFLLLLIFIPESPRFVVRNV